MAPMHGSLRQDMPVQPHTLSSLSWVLTSKDMKDRCLHAALANVFSCQATKAPGPQKRFMPP